MSGMTLEHENFPRLIRIEWEALHRLADVSGGFVATSLLSSAAAEQQRQDVQEFMKHGLARCQAASVNSVGFLTERRRQERDVAILRLPLNRWLREIDIAIASRLIEVPKAKINFLLSRWSGKAKAWALDKLVVDPNAFPTLRLAIDPTQDESRMRADFFALKQGKVTTRDYVEKTRHLASCIITSPVGMTSQVHAFVFGMRDGMTWYCLTRAKPNTLEEAFALVMREDYTVASSYVEVSALLQTPGFSHRQSKNPVQVFLTRLSKERNSQSTGRQGQRRNLTEVPVTLSVSRYFGRSVQEDLSD